MTMPVTPCENLNFGEVSFVNSPGGSLERNFIRQGFGLFTEQDRNRVEFAARMQNIWGRQTLKYGFEYQPQHLQHQHAVNRSRRHLR